MKADDYYKNTQARTFDWQRNEKEDSSNESSFPHIMQEITRLGVVNGAVLDVGCQAGTLLREMDGRFIERYGVDIGDYTDYWKKIEGCDFQIVNIDQEPLPFPDAYFDLVTCIMVLEHVFDVFNAVREISRVTRPGGHAIIEVPNISYFKHFYSLLRGRVPRTGKAIYPFEAEDGWDGQHLHYFTISELQTLAGKNAFRPVGILSKGRLPALRKLCPCFLFASISMSLQKEL